jgi:spore coat polysaccharide biosynthesis protein SpsF
MTRGVVILCRYNSTRLPGKILIDIDGKPVLQHIIDAISDLTLNFVVATSEASTDEPIVDYCEKNEIPYFRGNLPNVAKRFMDAAAFCGFDYAVRINGDNLFVNMEVLEKMLNIKDIENIDLLTNVPGRTYPFGMSAEMVRMDFYQKHYQYFNDSHKEHVTLYFYDNPEIGQRLEIKNDKVPNASGLNLAIDTAEDLKRAKFILKHSHHNKITNFSLGELVDLAKEYGK